MKIKTLIAAITMATLGAANANVITSGGTALTVDGSANIPISCTIDVSDDPADLTVMFDNADPTDTVTFTATTNKKDGVITYSLDALTTSLKMPDDTPATDVEFVAVNEGATPGGLTTGEVLEVGFRAAKAASAYQSGDQSVSGTITFTCPSA